jgi:predicted nucleic acid-binding protein
MGAMDARRLELYELLKPKLEEEAAQKLVLALSPDVDRLATKEFMDERLARLETTLTRRMVTILGAWTILVGSTVGWVAQALR